MSTIQEALRKARKERGAQERLRGVTLERLPRTPASGKRLRRRVVFIAASLVLFMAGGAAVVYKMGWMEPWSVRALWQSVFESKEKGKAPQKEVVQPPAAQTPPGKTGKAARRESPSPAPTKVPISMAPQGQPAQPGSGTAQRQGAPTISPGPAPQPVAPAAPVRTPPQTAVASPPPTQALAPSPKLPWLQEVRRLQVQGDLRGAESVLKELVDKDPKQTEALMALANLYLRDLKEPQKALPLYQRAMDLEPHRASFQVNMGVYYLKTGDRTRAMDHMRRAAALDPNLAEAHYNMACLYAQQGDLAQAEQALQWANKLDPRSERWAKEDPDLAPLRGASRR